jgi:flagellin
MSFTRINTNSDALLAGANLQKMQFQLSRTMSHLSTGLRIVTGSDDPSGTALVGTFSAQQSGVAMSVQNAQDGLSMMSTADSALADNMDMLLRMRDLAVRSASDATLTTTQRNGMENEYINLKNEITKRKAAITFNGKVLFSGGLSGKTIQVGPDNSVGFKLSLRIPILSVTNINGRSLAGAHVSQVNAAKSAIDLVQSAINGLSTLQNLVGSQEQMLERLVNDLSSEQVNIAAATSRIQDADMASEITSFAKEQIITQAAASMIAQANALPQSIMKTLGIG